MLISVTGGWGISYKIALRWIALIIDDKSTLNLVMAWCVMEQANTWANVDTDICRHMVPLGNNELIPVRVNNYIRYKVGPKVTFPFSNLYGVALKICEWMNNFITHFTRQVVPIVNMFS